MQQRLISVSFAEAREGDIACLGMRASIDSPVITISNPPVKSPSCRAYRSATSHRSQKTAIDLDDLLDRLTRDPVPSRRS